MLSDNFSNPKTSRVWLLLDNTELIVDRSKLRRARQRIRSVYENELKVVEPFQALYFDGRKDDTKVRTPNGSFKMIKEEHISLLQEPGSKYIVYLTPESSTARVVTDAFINFFQGNGNKTEDLIAVGCNSTDVKTGQHGSIIKLLKFIKETLNRPLHGFIYLLLCNLIHAVDGKTPGPSTLTGPIGKQLQTCEEKPVSIFYAISGEEIDFVESCLSTDQKYFLGIYRAVSTHFPLTVTAQGQLRVFTAHSLLITQSGARTQTHTTAYVVNFEPYSWVTYT